MLDKQLLHVCAVAVNGTVPSGVGHGNPGTCGSFDDQIESAGRSVVHDVKFGFVWNDYVAVGGNGASNFERNVAQRLPTFRGSKRVIRIGGNALTSRAVSAPSNSSKAEFAVASF